MIKKLLLLVVGLTLGVSLLAESIGVAIMPAIDRSGNVDEAYKFSIRQYIVMGITLVDGYEAYDRINLAAVLDEQKFQRDGMVNPADIKKIGEMTGAQYVLILETMLYPKDPDVILVSASFENVETAKIQQNATTRIHVTDENVMEDECKALARKLLRVSDVPDPQGPGAAKIGDSPNASSASSSPSQTQDEQTSGFVDMGLSVKWAACNVGASSPEQYGNFYGFDEMSAIKTGEGRCPTDAEWTELRANCSWVWTTMNGVKGMKATSLSTGKSLFLPAAGCTCNGYFYLSDVARGYYWSSTVRSKHIAYKSIVWCVWLDSSGVSRQNLNSRQFAVSVRPVTEY